MYMAASALAVGTKQILAGRRGDSERIKSSNCGLSGSIEKPPPPMATIWPLLSFIRSFR
jgi:hypothetical protein